MQKYFSSAKMVDLLNTLHESRRLKTNSIANLNRRIQPWSESLRFFCCVLWPWQFVSLPWRGRKPGPLILPVAVLSKNPQLTTRCLIQDLSGVLPMFLAIIAPPRRTSTRVSMVRWPALLLLWRVRSRGIWTIWNRRLSVTPTGLLLPTNTVLKLLMNTTSDSNCIMNIVYSLKQ